MNNHSGMLPAFQRSKSTEKMEHEAKCCKMMNMLHMFLLQFHALILEIPPKVATALIFFEGINGQRIAILLVKLS